MQTIRVNFKLRATSSDEIQNIIDDVYPKHLEPDMIQDVAKISIIPNRHCFDVNCTKEVPVEDAIKLLKPKPKFPK